MTTDRPVPVPDEASAPFWAAAREHRFVLPRCASCGAFDLPPEVVCRRCGSTEPAWTYEPVSGRGVVRSWTVVRRAQLPGLDAPYTVLDVELAEQADLRVIGRLLGDAARTPELGDEVEVGFDDVDDDHTVPGFRLVAR